MPTPPSPPSHKIATLQLSSSPPCSPTSASELESTSPTLPPPSQPSTIPPPSEEQRTAALQRELALLKSMNSTLTHLHATLSTSKTNLGTLQSTISSSAVLLDTWTRILSQAEHNARLIADSTWEGAGQDAVFAEREEGERKARVEREREERERRERERVASAAANANANAEKAAGQTGNRRGGVGRGPGTGRVLAGGWRGVPATGRRGSARGRAQV